ncbi:hypothetical protein O3P69_011856 [Scylla paramamosain]|uniref:XK-related protein n=1 Tax=Scylla paramamosain TaxID=85552 RepID=A0AAW0S964_SCYPA
MGYNKWDGPDDFPILDDPENLSTLWPDDPDSGHPFTKAALEGDLGTVRDYVARQTFDPASKEAQHALLVACRTDKDWRIISREEVGLCLVRVIEETAVCSVDAARSECFTLLYLAAQQGYPNMMHRLLSLKVSPDVRNNQGETKVCHEPGNALFSPSHHKALGSGQVRPTKTCRHHMRDMEIRKYYDLKHVAQMRVTITNVMEATLESAFQLILQLKIVGTYYNRAELAYDVTLGSILSLSPLGHNTQLSKQVFPVLISLVSLTWSFTSYHRFFKLGGLTILNTLSLLFAIFFQVEGWPSESLRTKTTGSPPPTCYLDCYLDCGIQEGGEGPASVDRGPHTLCPLPGAGHSSPGLVMPEVAMTDVRVLLPVVASYLTLLATLITVCVCVRKKPPMPLQQVSRDGNKVGVQENKDNHKHREQFYATVCKMSPHRDPTAVD